MDGDLALTQVLPSGRATPGSDSDDQAQPVPRIVVDEVPAVILTRAKGDPMHLGADLDGVAAK